MTIYNLEYKVLDKLGRAKKTLHGGVYLTEDALNDAKQQIETSNPDTRFSFDVYLIEPPIFQQ